MPDRPYLVVITGMSCRHQVSDGTGRRAQHVVEVLREALETP